MILNLRVWDLFLTMPTSSLCYLCRAVLLLERNSHFSFGISIIDKEPFGTLDEKKSKWIPSRVSRRILSKLQNHHDTLIPMHIGTVGWIWMHRVSFEIFGECNFLLLPSCYVLVYFLDKYALIWIMLKNRDKFSSLKIGLKHSKGKTIFIIIPKWKNTLWTQAIHTEKLRCGQKAIVRRNSRIFIDQESEITNKRTCENIRSSRKSHCALYHHLTATLDWALNYF